MVAKQHYDVVCGVIQNDRNEVLVSLRSLAQDNGGLWEFPGGKAEPGEQLDEALCRELNEELGIVLLEAEPWLQVHHEYEKYHVTLHVWRVVDFEADPEGVEGQPIRWIDLETLSTLEFPAANTLIIESLIKEMQIIH